MSLFADKWSSHFDTDPFGSETFLSTVDFSRTGCRSIPSYSLFENRSEDYAYPSVGKRNFDSALSRDNVFDHIDSIFQDFSFSDSRRHNSEGNDSRKSVPQPDGRGKEIIIPIKIETSSDFDKSGLSSSSSWEKNESKSLSSDSLSSGHDSAKYFIQIPIIRESSHRSSSKEKSQSPVVSDCFKIPPKLSPSALTIQETSSPDLRSKPNLDQNGFFNLRQPPGKLSLRQQEQPKADSNFEIVKIEEEIEEEEINIRSVRPKSLSRFQNDNSESVKTSCSSSGPEASSQWRCDVKSDVNLDEDRSGELEDLGGKRGSKDPRCSSTGLSDVTPSPSYPIYDLLKPRLASTGRQVDYIRGDGNCFFRALSKELYGSEDYHAEWREAVCDVVGAHPQVFSQYVDGSSVSHHVSSMRQPGTWATSCEIYGAATLLRREVYVLAPTSRSEENEYHWLLFSPRALSRSRSAGGSGGRGGGGCDGGGGGSSGDGDDEVVHPCYVTLCHTNGNHYDRITPVTARCNCELAPPSLNGVAVLMDLCLEEEEEEEREWHRR